MSELILILFITVLIQSYCSGLFILTFRFEADRKHCQQRAWCEFHAFPTLSSRYQISRRMSSVSLSLVACTDQQGTANASSQEGVGCRRDGVLCKKYPADDVDGAEMLNQSQNTKMYPSLAMHGIYSTMRKNIFFNDLRSQRMPGMYCPIRVHVCILVWPLV